MKKLMMGLLIAVAATSIALAHGGIRNNSNNSWGYQGMMHGGQGMMYGGPGMMGNYGAMNGISSEKLDDGISITLSNLNKEQVTNIKEILEKNKAIIGGYYNDSRLTITGDNDTLSVALTSKDENTIKQLQWDQGMIVLHTINHGDSRMGYGMMGQAYGQMGRSTGPMPNGNSTNN